jgi:hypothetical protein
MLTRAGGMVLRPSQTPSHTQDLRTLLPTGQCSTPRMQRTAGSVMTRGGKQEQAAVAAAARVQQQAAAARAATLGAGHMGRVGEEATSS